MKKVFIGLLIAAAGAAVYFLLQKKKELIIHQRIQKEQLIGKWKFDSLLLPKYSDTALVSGILKAVDPKLKNYQYEFKQNGTISLLQADSLTKDSMQYAWNSNDQLVWKEQPADTAGTTFSISALNKDSLLLLSNDSTLLLFKRVK